jgi:DNA topoisomerase-6 subunit B
VHLSSAKFKQLSPAEFFYGNRSMAGFDNQSRAVYTVLRELVENSLDACDSNGIRPVVYVSLSKVGQGDLEILVADNGSGIPRRYIADSFGKVFFGSKYSVKQNRGTFGLGGKMAILYGQLSTGEPVEVATSTGTEIHRVRLSIDVKLNQPVVHERKSSSNSSGLHGTTVRLRFKGDYVSARSRIVKYLRMTRIALPYSIIVFRDSEGLVFMAPSLTDELPKPPKESPPHPYGVDLVKLQEMIGTSKRTMPLYKFLRKFSRVGDVTAMNFTQVMGLDANKPISKMSDEEIRRISDGFKTYRFLPPDGTSLSPLGIETIRTGLKAEYSPEYIAIDQRPPSAYEGYSFIVETAIAYGGGILPPNGVEEVKLLRFANKIPLIYDASNDVSMHVILEDMDWKNYKLNLKTDPLLFFVHIAATKVPFKTAGKEYVADREEIRREIRLGFRECARVLRNYLSKKINQIYRSQRNEKMTQYLTLLSKYSSGLAGKPEIPHERLRTLIQLGVSWEGYAGEEENGSK